MIIEWKTDSAVEGGDDKSDFFFFRLLSTQDGTSIAVELSTVLRDDDKPRKNFLVLNKQATWYDNPATHCSK